MQKENERKIARRVVRRVAKEMRSRGFLHSKPTFVVRPFQHFAQFIHFHKFTGGPRFRVHLGVRVFSSSFEAIALNGPSFEHAGSFREDEDSTLDCVSQLLRVIETDGLRWFAEHGSVEMLISASDIDNFEDDRSALMEDIRGLSDRSYYVQSHSLLGLSMEEEAEPGATDNPDDAQH